MSNQRPADELRSFRDRIVRSEEEKQAISDGIKDIYAEAKARGYDVKALRLTVKRAREDAKARRERVETEEIAGLYMATLGMLDGTPLGEAARQRAAQRRAEPDPDEDAEAPEAGEADSQTTIAPESIGPEQIEEARQRGRDDAQAGKRILDNPFISGDPRRASWDEGFCEALGTDGMDIPPAFRRSKRKKGGEE